MSVVRWNLRPGGGTWVECYIWGTIEDMLDYTEHRLDRSSRDHLACFIGTPYRFRDDRLVTRKLGEIHLVEGEFGVGIVAHELQHFLVQYTHNLNWDVDNAEWEDVAYLAGDLTNEFWNSYWRHYV